MDNTVGRLSEKQLSLIIGSVLGDGYIRIMPNRSDAFLEINHSYKAKDYVDFKYNVLKNICSGKPTQRFTDQDKVKSAYRFFTNQHSEITEIYNAFYKNKRKVIPKDLKLNPIILAIWYMDDGSKTQSTKNTNNINVYLNSQNFSLNDQKYLLHLLRQVNIKARLNKDKQNYRIRILKESINTFMSMIKPYVIESMSYKLVDKII